METTVKSIAQLSIPDRIGILAHEIEQAEKLLRNRNEWLNNTINKKKSTYQAIATDTREMEYKLDEKREELASLKKKIA